MTFRPPARWLWTALGVMLGGAVTAGVALGLATLIRGDAPVEPLGAPVFENETETSGIDHRYDGEFHFFVGGGVAVFDCDGDQDQDLYIAGGADPAALYRNISIVGGRLVFERLGHAVTDLGNVTGAYPLDADSDGETDLAVLRLGENVVLRGLGDCRFERANESWGVEGGDAWTTAFSATWERGEDLPTLVFGNYLALDEAGAQTGDCADHQLIRPEGGEYGAPEKLTPGWCTLSALLSDWSGSGDLGLRLTNDRHYYLDGEEQLWRLSPGERPVPFGRDDGWQKMQIWGMGIASHDVTGDGMPEVFLTSQGDNKLQTLADGSAQPHYEDIALSSGANVPRPFSGDINRPSTAWHAEFEDVNNDGFIDLFVTKGNVEAMPEFAQRDPNNLLLGQPGAKFVESAGVANLVDFDRSRGAALADFNLDGMIDVVVVDRREPVKVWRNLGSGTSGDPSPMGNWVAVQLRQAGVNRDAIGSWIELRLGNTTMRRELTIGGGHAGGQLGWVHFGLGRADDAEIRVIWPDAEVGPWHSVDANRFFVIDRETGTARAALPVPD